MKYYCFYLDCGARITDTTIVISKDTTKIEAVEQVLDVLDYKEKIVDNIDEFVNWAKDLTNKIQIIKLY